MIFVMMNFDMIWDSRYYCWVEPYVDECAMGFHSHVTKVFGLLELIEHQISGQIMDLNFFHMGYIA
jgi:hypothetical protein